MSKVYSVAHGKIKEYELLKETNCFYNIQFNGHKDRLSKDGQSLPYRLGGRSTVTTDVLAATVSAQSQINIITNYLAGQQLELSEAESELEVFLAKHTGAES